MIIVIVAEYIYFLSAWWHVIDVWHFDNKILNYFVLANRTSMKLFNSYN